MGKVSRRGKKRQRSKNSPRKVTSKKLYWVVLVSATVEQALGMHLGIPFTKESRKERAVTLVNVGRVTAIWPFTDHYEDVVELAANIEEIVNFPDTEDEA